MVFTFYVPVVLCLLSDMSRRCINYWSYTVSTIKAMRRDHGGTKRLWNVRLLLRDCTAQYPRKLSSSFNKISKGNEPRQMSKRNRRFEDHLCPHHQGCDVIPELTVPHIYSSPGQYAKTIRRRTNGKRRPSRDRITTPPVCVVLAGHYYNEWPGGAIYSVFQKSLYREEKSNSALLGTNPSWDLFKHSEACFYVSAGVGEGASTRAHILNNFCNAILKEVSGFYIWLFGTATFGTFCIWGTVVSVIISHPWWRGPKRSSKRRFLLFIWRGWLPDKILLNPVTAKASDHMSSSYLRPWQSETSVQHFTSVKHFSKNVLPKESLFFPSTQATVWDMWALVFSLNRIH
jgi:hypothetical protein